ncbi:MAG TPA: asparagine synthase (glutamine-hydrolyzing) [Vicinamibacterales bacterium]|nr:asparagine synthase (glutamine-hydrolyzing) [Vicinamibacterales bacterium]
MCGIAGVLNINGEAADAALLKRMTDAIAHRGPDGEGYYLDGPVGLGHRRLSIIDLSDAAAQPLPNEQGNVLLIYNGEIYNFRELRAELEALGHSFRSRTDSEVIVHGYEQWGDECVTKLNGMFAFGLWDGARRRLLVARDRHGIKPLYYWQDGATFAFASEIKALLEHPRLTRRVDRQALLEYFTFQNLFTDRTLFDKVRMLPAGCTMSVTASGADAPRRYWDYQFREPDSVKDSREYEEELHRLFVAGVTRQLVSDVPLGAYLSGGMDSGGITAVATRHIPNLNSFTAGFDLSSASGLELHFDERERAESLSSQFKTEHYEVVLKSGDMERVMPELIWHLEDLRVGQCYPNYYVSRLASKFVKVVLAGTGGDELYGGYPWRYYRAANSQDPHDYVRKYYQFWQRLVPNTIIHRLFQPDIWSSIKELQTIDVMRSVINGTDGPLNRPEDYVNRSMYFECKTFLHGLLLVEDKLSMAHGLETRVPFLDNDIVDFAMRVPVRAKLRQLDEATRLDENIVGPKNDLYFNRTSDGKIVLRRMLEQLLPIQYVEGAKQGFSAPDASWFRGESIQYVQRLILDPQARLYEFLRPDTVSQLVGEHLRGGTNRRLLIWSLLSFEWWLRVFMADGRR